MGAPAASIVVTNTGSESAWAGGEQIAPQGSYTFTDSTATNLASLCEDLNFRAGFLNGQFAIVVNGFGVNATSGVNDMLDQIAAGTVG